MIILFSFSLGIMTVKYKKRQIEYIDDLLYISRKTAILLKSVSADTQSIMKSLKKDSRLANFDFSLEQKSSPLKENENEKIRDFFHSMGKYDLDSQLKIIDEFTGNFKMLKDEYQVRYDSHKKLYIAVSLLSGVLVAVILA